LIEARVTNDVFIEEIQRLKELALKHTDDKISELDAYNKAVAKEL